MNEKEMWLKLACAGVAAYEVPDDFDGGLDELVTDMGDVAEEFANEMLDRFEDKFGPIAEGGERRPAKRGGGRGRGKGRVRRGEPPPAQD